MKRPVVDLMGGDCPLPVDFCSSLLLYNFLYPRAEFFRLTGNGSKTLDKQAESSFSDGTHRIYQKMKTVLDVNIMSSSVDVNLLRSPGEPLRIKEACKYYEDQGYNDINIASIYTHRPIDDRIEIESHLAEKFGLDALIEIFVKSGTESMVANVECVSTAVLMADDINERGMRPPVDVRQKLRGVLVGRDLIGLNGNRYIKRQDLLGSPKAVNARNRMAGMLTELTPQVFSKDLTLPVEYVPTDRSRPKTILRKLARRSGYLGVRGV
jgi:hypothetical protein